MGIGRSALAMATILCLAAALSRPAVAQDAPDAAIGPCSPIAYPDGDIRSDLPGCKRHARPVPGTLDDELAFRRARRDASDPVERPRGRRSRRDWDGDPDD